MDRLGTFQLTDHFAVWEFRCPGADKFCACHGAVQVDDRLPLVLEEIRAHVGGPLRVTSGFRCDVYNAMIDGHPGSFHRVGKAADVASSRMPTEDLPRIAAIAGRIIVDRYGEIGNVLWYPERGHLHVDVGHRIGDGDIVRRMDG